MNNIVLVNLESTYASAYGIWQWDYGQILRIQSKKKLPKAVEVHFSEQGKGGSSITRIGTTADNVTDVPIPDSLLEKSGNIYAFVYIEDGQSGNTEYKIEMSVKARPKPEVPRTPEEPELFKETIKAVNDAADRAETAERNAKDSATKAEEAATSAIASAKAAEEAKTEALEEIGNKKQDVLSSIQTQKEESLSAIQEQESNSVSKVTEQADTEVQRIQNAGAESKRALDQSIQEASEKKTALDSSIQTADTSKADLDKSVETAGTVKSELDASTEKAKDAKTELDGSIQTAGEKKTALDTTVGKARELDTSLTKNIESGTQLQKDLVASGEKAVQDIQSAGTEQLDKMQTVADEFEADREQVNVNKENIASLTEDLSNKITKFYASNQGEAHITDSDDGKMADMKLYGKSEQKQYKGINLFPPDTKTNEYAEVSIPKGSLVFWATDGTPAKGGNFRFFNEDKTESMWLGIDSGTTSMRQTLTIDAKYVQNLIKADFDLSKICLGVGNKAIYEPYTGGIPSPSPDYPQEIKSVVNPTIKVCGADIMRLNDVGENTLAGITVSCKDGVIKAKGTALQDYTIPLGGSAGFIVMKSMTLQNSKTYIFNPNRINGTESSECYLDFTNAYNLGISFSNNNINNPIKPTDLQTQYLFNLNLIVKQGTVVDGEWKPQLLSNESLLPYEPYKEQSIQLPITLNAIPVKSGGNVTINGQQYIADYVDVEHRKVIRNILKWRLADVQPGFNNTVWHMDISGLGIDGSKLGLSNMFNIQSRDYAHPTISEMYIESDGKAASLNMRGMTDEEFKKWIIEKNPEIYSVLTVAEEIPITLEEASAFKQLMTYYPVTNISVNSEQLDGYTVFNYPISMENGWNYVKQQIGDTRDYIYDMDTKTQDIDTQAAEAYVNSEYAVALTELEV